LKDLRVSASACGLSGVGDAREVMGMNGHGGGGGEMRTAMLSPFAATSGTPRPIRLYTPPVHPASAPTSGNCWMSLVFGAKAL
jgi:hypothetical protein